ncbi:MAG: hypothetical protein AAF676_09020 [Pseudomonadota bacterium]
MDATPEVIRFGAIDAALLGAFYMSYGIFGLVQLVSLFEGRPLRFALLLLASGALAQGFGAFDADGFCLDGRSAIICNNGARGLVGLGMAWVWVSLGMLAMFAGSRGLSRLRAKREGAGPD